MKKCTKLGIFALFAYFLVNLAGCSATLSAYQTATTTDDYAYVLISQYSATLDQVAEVVQSGTLTDAQIADMQKVVTVATAAVHSLNDARIAYNSSKSANDLTTLQTALSDAVTAVSSVLTLIHTYKGVST